MNNPFRRRTLASLLEDDLYQCELDMRAARHNLEYWSAQVAMLQVRAARLRGEDKAKVTPLPRIQTP